MARWWSHTLYIYSKKVDIIPVDYNFDYRYLSTNCAISTEQHHVFLASTDLDTFRPLHNAIRTMLDNVKRHFYNDVLFH